MGYVKEAGLGYVNETDPVILFFCRIDMTRKRLKDMNNAGLGRDFIVLLFSSGSENNADLGGYLFFYPLFLARNLGNKNY